MVKDGVPQGDPGSPLAFNLSIDFILHYLHKAFAGRGISLSGNEECIALGFADDLVITAKSLGDAEIMSKCLRDLLLSIGLELNTSKCKAFAINTPICPSQLSPDLPIDILGKKDVLKYLGAEILVEGKPSHEKVKNLITKRCEHTLIFPYLQNWQKLAFCRMFITSLLPYPAQTDFNMNISKSPAIINACRSINLMLESIFHLTGVHRSFVNGSKCGGLGFPNPKWIISSNALNTAGYIYSSNDKQIQALIELNDLKMDQLITTLTDDLYTSVKPAVLNPEILKEKLLTICKDDKKMKVKRTTEVIQAAACEAWYTTVSGRIAGGKQFGNSRISAFMRRPEEFSNAELQAAIRLRGGVPDLRCLRHVAEKHGTDKCRLCGSHTESIGHILGGCQVMHKLITNRHDTALKELWSELKSKNPEWDFELEARPNANVVHHKPDIVATHKNSLSTIIFDLTIRTESTDLNKRQEKEEKIRKYEPLQSFYINVKGASNFHVQPLWFGARGGIDEDAIKVLTNNFNISKPFLETFTTKIFKLSIRLYFKVIHS